LGMSFRKAAYIREATERIVSGELDLHALRSLPDEAVCEQLVRLRGVGRWTAEMLLLFSLERPDIISFDDLGIHRGMRMLYGLEKVDRPQFEAYRKRYAPYASVASLYLWAISSGAIPELLDPSAARIGKT
ncbi:MAG TPA: DNA-3-methyladenine glycosylase 2 family protein, partial [Clostridia bacterium]|nr:DNA-3-methyladenine glycosylase 2 family protein [Clostridia bacterium]